MDTLDMSVVIQRLARKMKAEGSTIPSSSSQSGTAAPISSGRSESRALASSAATRATSSEHDLPAKRAKAEGSSSREDEPLTTEIIVNRARVDFAAAELESQDMSCTISRQGDESTRHPAYLGLHTSTADLQGRKIQEADNLMKEVEAKNVQAASEIAPVVDEASVRAEVAQTTAAEIMEATGEFVVLSEDEGDVPAAVEGAKGGGQIVVLASLEVERLESACVAQLVAGKAPNEVGHGDFGGGVAVETLRLDEVVAGAGPETALALVAAEDMDGPAVPIERRESLTAECPSQSTLGALLNHMTVAKLELLMRQILREELTGGSLVTSFV